jgi:hypothetical protein
MRSLIILMILLSGCVPYKKGLQVADSEAVTPLINFVASDSVSQISKLYPPTSTELNFVGGVSDKLGEAMAGRLRKEGYSVIDNAKMGKEGKPIEYVMDNIGNKTFRASLFIDGSVMSRIYRNDSPIVALGAWSLGGKNGK